MKLNFTSLPVTAKPLHYPLVTKMYLLLLSSLLLLSLQTQAQGFDNHPDLMYLKNTSSLSLQLGGNNFLGDLGGTRGTGKPFAKDLNLKATRPYVGLAYSYFPANSWSVNAELHLTSVAGADSLIEEKVGHALGRYERNLSFKSTVYELQSTIDLYPLQLLDETRKHVFMPYVGAGIGLFHFNPKAELNGSWYYLQPLHLEGQGFAEYPDRKNYKLTQVYIPLKVGVKYRVSNNYFVSLNALFRKTFTDYIDDVSTTYIDPALFDKYLSSYAANIAKQLYYRGRSGVAPHTNDLRGYGGNDSYTSVYLGITYLFNNGTFASAHDTRMP